MTDKGTTDQIAQRYIEVCAERDALRAKVERHERRFREAEAEWVERFERLEAENERLKKAYDVEVRAEKRERDALTAEVEQLHQELADAHSAHATVADLLREANKPQPDALDSHEMETMPF
jgi:predicted  nucleic acid-binding Zn-ribbon protein